MYRFASHIYALVGLFVFFFFYSSLLLNLHVLPFLLSFLSGVFGYPWFATVTCPEGATWTAEGWPVDQVVFYLMDGAFRL